MTRGDLDKAIRFFEKSLRLFPLPGVEALKAKAEKMRDSTGSASGGAGGGGGGGGASSSGNSTPTTSSSCLSVSLYLNFHCLKNDMKLKLYLLV